MLVTIFIILTPIITFLIGVSIYYVVDNKLKKLRQFNELEKIIENWSQ